MKKALKPVQSFYLTEEETEAHKKNDFPKVLQEMANSELEYRPFDSKLALLPLQSLKKHGP